MCMGFLYYLINVSIFRVTLQRGEYSQTERSHYCEESENRISIENSGKRQIGFMTNRHVQGGKGEVCKKEYSGFCSNICMFKMNSRQVVGKDNTIGHRLCCYF